MEVADCKPCTADCNVNTRLANTVICNIKTIGVGGDGSDLLSMMFCVKFDGAVNYGK